jgi:hypothetical protein
VALRVVVGAGLALVLNSPDFAAASSIRYSNYAYVAGGSSTAVRSERLHRHRWASNHASRRYRHYGGRPPASESRTVAELSRQVRSLRTKLDAVGSLRDEVTALKQQVLGSIFRPLNWSGLPLSLMSASNRAVGVGPFAAMVTEASVLLSTNPLRLPVNPATASLPAVIREQQSATLRSRSAVEEAKTYLIDTATPGFTMTRQGIALSIERLHPGFVVKLAEAIKRARSAGLTNAGVFSSYRPPAFGIGGFKNKFNSLHSYGLAVDMTGIGHAGSLSARVWQSITIDVGLHLPYGPYNRAEYNHTQFVKAKVAPPQLRTTISANGPKNLREMWLASGINLFMEDPPAELAPTTTAKLGETVAAGGPQPSATLSEPAPQKRAPRKRSTKTSTRSSRGRTQRPSRAPHKRSAKVQTSRGRRRTSKLGSGEN